MTDAKFETELSKPLIKPKYFYGDSIQEEGNCMIEGLYRRFHTIDDLDLFHPEMPRMHALSYL